MPNWCENDLIVKGKFEYLGEFIEFVKGLDSIFDFNEIAPMPEVFEGVVTGFNTIDGKRYENWRTQNIDGVTVSIGVEQDELDRWKAEYGYDNWCDWSCKNWGTKWNACEPVLAVYDDHVKYTFSTAWSPPTPIIAALAKRFPKVEFSHKYYECGCAFKGYAKYKKGVVIEHGEGTYAGRRGG